MSTFVVLRGQNRRAPAMRHLPAALALCATLAASGAAHAQAAVSGISVIAPGAGAGVSGALTVNETAGLNNAQSNQLSIATGGTTVGTDNLISQGANAAARLRGAIAGIGDNAFANTSGAVMVNQSAGVGNLQSNSAQISTAAVGVETVSDNVLSATAATNGGRGQTVQTSGIREASISNSAFRNATGLVQVNQTAGAGNATANSFVLRPPAGTLF
ncbi:hypothetical protein [Paraburkholderia sp. J67]|uniref:hypothetical protein n=1 Tax=Paraburkholderia sp. J67 TaxID=2805435 RepID=UPI002ABD5BC6|nr:hypothetical protein [Paraburkholderia sp. J67]